MKYKSTIAIAIILSIFIFGCVPKNEDSSLAGLDSVEYESSAQKSSPDELGDEPTVKSSTEEVSPQQNSSNKSEYNGKPYNSYLQFNYLNEHGLFEAVRTENLELVQFLIKNGINVNHRNIEGQTALMVKGYGMPYPYDICLELIEAGADFDVIDNYGFNMLDYAYQREQSNLKLIQELENRGLKLANGYPANKNSTIYQQFIADKEDDDSFTVSYYPNGNVRMLFKTGFPEPTEFQLLNLQDDVFSFYYDASGDVSKIITEFAGTGAQFSYTLLKYNNDSPNIAVSFFVYQNLTAEGILEIRTIKF